ncbi:MAG: hypothetical protein ACQKBT_08210 [Puniceicoccales bacterium]
MKKNKSILLGLLLAVFFSLNVQAEGGDPAGQDQELESAPNGGRLFEAGDHIAEFFFTPERLVEIRFLDDRGEVVETGEREVSLIGGDRTNPIRLKFEVIENVFVSTTPIPEGNNFPVILTVRDGDQTIRERFNLNTSNCPGCQLGEYACTCDH